MKTKESKLIKLEQTIADLGLSSKEVINHLSAKICRIPKSDISRIKPGMYWFEDDTFSREKIAGMKVKAIVELVDSNGIIYGDLTASEIFNIDEKYLKYYDAENYIENFSYPFKDDEGIVLYDHYQLQKVFDFYARIDRSFKLMDKKPRLGKYLSSNGKYEISTDLGSEITEHTMTEDVYPIRPVLALSTHKIDISQVEVGMYWYSDNTFSFNRLHDKKIKAIVELVENRKIYGDLTASELYNIEEKAVNWFEGRDHIKRFSYPCNKDEKIVSYDCYQIQKIGRFRECDKVKKAFEQIGKKARCGNYVHYGYNPEDKVFGITFVSDGNNLDLYANKTDICFIRPVLCLNVE